MRKDHGRYHFPILIGSISLIGLAAFYLLGAVRGYAQQPAAKPVATIVGGDTCTECHSEIRGQLEKSPHGLAIIGAAGKGRGQLCEGCHGPGSLHVADPSAETALPLKQTATSGEGCFSCHDLTLSRTEWLRSNHHREGVSCVSCHGMARTVEATLQAKVEAQKAAKPEEAAPQGQTATPPAADADAKLPFSHADFTRVPSTEACLSCHSEKRAELALPSHHPVQEGRIGCSDCHDPHTRMTERTKRELCVTCHAKQQSPHLFEHGAISAGRLTDGCLDCHEPHGSPNQRLLKITNRGLCLQCHADRATHFVGRNCIECHQAVHGSNTSPLLFRE